MIPQFHHHKQVLQVSLECRCVRQLFYVVVNDMAALDILQRPAGRVCRGLIDIVGQCLYLIC